MPVARRKFDPYRILGLDRSASPDDVKRAYRRKAKETHPDAGGDRKEFEDVTRANLVLIDPSKRQHFDETGDIGDDAPNTIDAKAMNLINGLMQAILSDDRDPMATDIVKAMSNVFGSQINELADKLRPVQRAKDRAIKMRDRFKRKHKGENQMHRMLDWHLDAINQSIRNIEEETRQRQRAIEILADYKFERDMPQAQARGFIFSQSFAGSSTSTSF